MRAELPIGVKLSLRRALVAFAVGVACAWVACAVIPRPRLAEAVLPAPARVYARPLVLAPGLRVSMDAITSHLMRAGYRRTGAEPAPGQYRVRGRTLDAALRPFRFPDGEDPGGRFSVTLDARGDVARLTGADGTARDVVVVEPELLGVLFGARAQDRVMLPLEEIPPHVVDAVLAVEDRRFYYHPGIDPIRIGGALLANLRARRFAEGGSTLTQQLAKNVYLSPERTLWRKLREVLYALWIEARYSKHEILEAYLNQVYLGQSRGVGIHGVGRAARFYFGKEVADLSVAEAALLAGLIQAPNGLSPFRHAAEAKARRDVVLALMREQGKLDAVAFEKARSAPLGVKSEPPVIPFAAHFVDFVRGRVVDALGEEAVEDGLDVFSTVDGNLQRAAENALREGLRSLEQSYPKLRRAQQPLEGALVAIDPATGDVLAMAGGRDYVRSPFNRAVGAHRQPGSVFKPVVALAAFTARADPPLTLATLLQDAPLEMEVDGEPWRPTNMDGHYRGAVSVRRALEQSLNVPMVRLGLETGLVHVADTARRLGATSELRPAPSLSLGAFEMTPLEVASMYAVLAAGGVRSQPRSTLVVMTGSDGPRGGERLERERVFSEAETYLVTSALLGAVRGGTGRALASWGVRGPVAGKTGTSNEARDAWFAAYTTSIAVAVWVGFDDGARVGLTGSQAALPIFARFAKAGLPAPSYREFPVPDGLERTEIHGPTGLRAAPGCRGAPEIFLAGTAPRERCVAPPIRRGWDWLRRLFGR